jgi:hypothetical protein
VNVYSTAIILPIGPRDKINLAPHGQADGWAVCGPYGVGGLIDIASALTLLYGPDGLDGSVFVDIIPYFTVKLAKPLGMFPTIGSPRPGIMVRPWAEKGGVPGAHLPNRAVAGQ